MHETDIQCFLNAECPGIRAWARKAAEWCLERDLHEISTASMGATLLGCATNWALMTHEVRCNGCSLDTIRNRLDCAAQARTGGKTTPGTGPVTHLSAACTAVWRAVRELGLLATFHTGTNRVAAFAEQWRSLEDALLDDYMFAEVLQTAGLSAGPRFRSRIAGYAQATDAFERAMRLLRRAEPQFLRAACASPSSGRLMSPDLIAWTRKAVEWGKRLRMPGLTVAAYAATMRDQSEFWFLIERDIRQREMIIGPLLRSFETSCRAEHAREWGSDRAVDLFETSEFSESSEPGDRDAEEKHGNISAPEALFVARLMRAGLGKLLIELGLPEERQLELQNELNGLAGIVERNDSDR